MRIEVTMFLVVYESCKIQEQDEAPQHLSPPLSSSAKKQRKALQLIADRYNVITTPGTAWLRALTFQ
jgi:hypothetical protein